MYWGVYMWWMYYPILWMRISAFIHIWCYDMFDLSDTHLEKVYQRKRNIYIPGIWNSAVSEMVQTSPASLLVWVTCTWQALQCSRIVL